MFKRRAAICMAGILSVLCLMGCSGGDAVVIASKDFTENKLVAEMFAQVIEKNTSVEVTRKLNMGGTFVCFEAIKSGEADIYPEYTGTALTAQLKLPVEGTPDEIYDRVSKDFSEQFSIKWLEPIGFNNTYAVALSQELVDKYGLQTTSDLAPYASELKFGAEHEFFDRQDGYDGLVDVYGLDFKEAVKMNVSLKYQAVADGQIDVTDAFTTDGQLKALNLVVLEDDAGFFPPYYCAPIIREETLQEYPELEDVLNKFAGLIDDVTMQDLNYQVDNEKKSIEEVASAFLTEKGLI